MTINSCNPKTCTMKPFEGLIFNWERMPCDEKGFHISNLTTKFFYILGMISPGKARATSRVLDLDRKSGLVETLNSYYILVGEEEKGLLSHLVL